MQTLIAVIALAGSIASNNIPDRPRWQTDYFEARSKAIDGGKPLAVFIGSSKTDWTVDTKVNEWMRDKYVCVFIDTDTTPGKSLAGQFAVDRKGLIISDRSGNSQQFHHNGDVQRDDLVKALQRYADPNRVFRSTESLAQLSPPPAPTYPTYAPTYTPTYRLSGG